MCGCAVGCSPSCAVGCDPVALNRGVPRGVPLACTYEYTGGQYRPRNACVPPSVAEFAHRRVFRGPNVGGCVGEEPLPVEWGYQRGAPWPRQGHDDGGTCRAEAAGPRTPSPPQWAALTTTTFFSSSPVVSANGHVFLCGQSDGWMYAVEGGAGEVLWSTPTGSACTQTAAVATGGILIYSGNNDGAVHAVDLNTCVSVWSYAVPNNEIVSGVAVTASGLVIVGSFFGSVFAVFQANGTAAWAWPSPASSYFVFTAPTLSADSAVVYWFEYVAGWVVAADAATGSTLWTSDVSAYGRFSQGEVTVGPNGTLFVTNNDASTSFLVALSAADGSVQWSLTLSNSTALSSLILSPDASLAYAADGDGHVLAFDLQAHTQRWVVGGGGAHSYTTGAVGADGVVYWAGDNGVFGYSGDSGAVVWSNTDVSNCHASLALSSDGTLFVGCNNGGLVAFRDTA